MKGLLIIFMWGAKLLAAILVTSGITANALFWRLPPEGIIDGAAAATTNKMEKFVYPGSQMVSNDSGSYVLIAETSLDEATNWYSKAMDENKMKEKSVIKSDANGDKINLIIGESLAGEMDVAIKEETNGVVTIAITRNISDSKQI